MAATGLLGFNPYRKGVVVDISSKPTALYVDLQNKERARQDALDRYFMDYDKNINPAGMRNIDIDDLLKLNQESKQFYYQNKKAIQNPMVDGGRAYSVFNNLYKKQQGLISSSKQQAAEDLVLQKAMQESKQKGMVIAPSVFEGVKGAQKRILDPEYRKFSMSNFDAYKPFDIATFQKNLYGSKGETYMVSTIPNVVTRNGINIGTKVTEFDPKSFDSVKQFAKSNLMINRGFLEAMSAVATDKNEFDRLNKVYNKYAGKNIENLEDIATAFSISIAPSKIEAIDKGQNAWFSAAARAAYSPTQSVDPNPSLENIYDTGLTTSTGGEPYYGGQSIVSADEANQAMSQLPYGTRQVSLPEAYLDDLKIKVGDLQITPQITFMAPDKSIYLGWKRSPVEKLNIQRIAQSKVIIDFANSLKKQGVQAGSIPQPRASQPKSPKPPAPEKKEKKKIPDF